MRVIFQAIVLFITLSVTAQNPLEKKVGDFNLLGFNSAMLASIVKSVIFGDVKA